MLESCFCPPNVPRGNVFPLCWSGGDSLAGGCGFDVSQGVGVVVLGEVMWGCGLVDKL